MTEVNNIKSYRIMGLNLFVPNRETGQRWPPSPGPSACQPGLYGTLSRAGGGWVYPTCPFLPARPYTLVHKKAPNLLITALSFFFPLHFSAPLFSSFLFLSSSSLKMRPTNMPHGSLMMRSLLSCNMNR